MGLYFHSPQLGWAVGSGGTILKTVDGGKKWKKVASGTTASLSAVFFSRREAGMGRWSQWDDSPEPRRGEYVASATRRYPGGFYGLSFVSPSEGWVVGGNGTILHTKDGGIHWVDQASKTSAALYGVQFLTAQHGTSVGAVGTVLMTDDGGITWTPQETQGAVTLFDVYFSDTSTGWVVGNAGAIFHTTDGGHQWIDRTLPCTRTCTKLTDLLRVRFTDPQTGWIVGERGMVYRTTDSGFTWTEQGAIAKVSLFGLSFPDGTQGWASGENGTIVHLTSAAEQGGEARERIEIFARREKEWGSGLKFRPFPSPTCLAFRARLASLASHISSSLDWRMLSAAMAAVSARRIRGPRASGRKPCSCARRCSSGAHPPSGPINKTIGC